MGIVSTSWVLGFLLSLNLCLGVVVMIAVR